MNLLLAFYDPSYPMWLGLDAGPDFGCAGKPISASWQEVPKQEKNRMVAAARLTLLELDSTHGGNDNAGRYFAKAGEAEWGC